MNYARFASEVEQSIREYHRLILEDYTKQQIDLQARIVERGMEDLQLKNPTLYQSVYRWATSYEDYVKKK